MGKKLSRTHSSYKFHITTCIVNMLKCHIKTYGNCLTGLSCENTADYYSSLWNSFHLKMQKEKNLEK